MCTSTSARLILHNKHKNNMKRRLGIKGNASFPATTNHSNSTLHSCMKAPKITKKKIAAPTALAKKGVLRSNESATAATAKTNKTLLESHEDSNLLNAPRTRGRDDDSLSRFPNFNSPGGILRGLDYGGTLTFALSGSIIAAQSGLDVFGCSMVAMITAVGGGTIRDAVFLARRPFWTSETEYIWMSIITGFLTFFTWPTVLDWKEERRLSIANVNNDIVKGGTSTDRTKKNTYYDELDFALDTLDAIGLSAFAIIGAQNGVRAGMPMIVSAICGMATSTFGGLTRDVLCGRPVRIVHSNAEIYAQPALAGAVTYLGAKGMNLSPGLRIGSAIFVCLGSRFMAVKHDVKLHTWETKEDNDGLGVAIRK
eukprot:scaffold749_cov242-Chaetoceros_neogracile.AAC.17